MKKINYFLFFFLFVMVNASAWNQTGHRITAEAAYLHLNLKTKEKVDDLVLAMQQKHRKIKSFSDMSVWPDQLHKRDHRVHSDWHYVNIPISIDGTFPENNRARGSALRVLPKLEQCITDERKAKSKRAECLAWFVHIIADLHQPLHTVSLYSRDFPHGDRGGNAYFISYGKFHTLHQLWDAGVGAFSPRKNKDWVNDFPAVFFRDQVFDQDPAHWVNESVLIAKEVVYKIPLHDRPSYFYLQTGERIAKERLMLASYRLSERLNQMF